MYQIIKRVISRLHNEKKIFFWLTFVNLLFSFLVLLEPIFFKYIIDTLIAFGEIEKPVFSELFGVLVIWVFVAFITIISRLFVTIGADRMAHREFDRNVGEFFDKILHLSMRFHLDSNSGQLVKKITKGCDGMFEIQVNFFRRVLPNILTILFLIPVVLYFDIKLGLFVIMIGILSSIITFWLAIKTFVKQEKVEGCYSKLSGLYGDTFSNMPIVKSFALNRLKDRELKKLQKKRFDSQYPILNYWGTIVSFSKIINIIVSIGVISFGSYLYILGEVSIGSIVMFLSFSVLFLASIEDLTWTLEGMFWRLAGIKEYFEIVDTPIEVKDSKGAYDLKKVRGSIDFKGVTFSYDGDRKVLKNINISVEAGEKIAFVGHTGSGKTTMTNLLLRFFDPQKGRIFIDGHDISELTQTSLRRNIGVVFQDNSMFYTTILNNIRLDNIKASKKDIEDAAKRSHVYDFIKNLSKGFSTIVGERGVKLSGGEKQRIALARAFLKDAPILVLDEATSALDAETEKYLQASLDELMQKRTTFIIAHRLSTIRNVDRIFVFDKGKIVESGSYDELVKQKGKFSKLVNAQVGGFVE